MAVGGAGGLLGQLFNPGLDDRLATHLTPNPNPLFQQGQGAQPGTVDSLGNPSPSAPPPGSNMAPAASTQPDPVNNSYIADLLAAQRRDANAQTFNEGLDQMAASFGTAQQQASKQNALRHGGGGVGDSLAALKDIQGMQDQTIQDNEHARFMGNAATFAQSMSQALGRPVSVQEATEAMNNPDLLKAYTGAAGANMQTPDKLKEADAEARAWADAHKDATPAEIAQHKSDFLAQTAGGLSTVGKQLAEDRRNWMMAHKGASFADMIADKPELADETTYVTIKAEQGKQSVIAGQEKQTAKDSFPQADQAYKQIEDTVDWLNDPTHRDAVQKAINLPREATGGYGGAALAKMKEWGLPVPDIPQDVRDARIKLDYLKNQQYAENFTGTKNVRSNTEATRLGASASSLDNINASEDTVSQQLASLKNRVYRERANLAAAAGKVVPYKYRGLADNSFLDKKSNVYQGGSEEVPEDLSSMSDADMDAAVNRLPSGRAFKANDGKVHIKS